jgi:hypothetical protein
MWRSGGRNGHIPSRDRRGGAWLALVALLFHLLMPLAPALAGPADSGTFPAACHAEPAGAAVFVTSDEPGAAGDAGAPPFQDCTLCILHCAGGLGLTVIALGAPAPSVAAVGRPSHPDGNFGRRMAAVDPGYPRGPPLA